MEFLASAVVGVAVHGEGGVEVTVIHSGNNAPSLVDVVAQAHSHLYRQVVVVAQFTSVQGHQRIRKALHLHLAVAVCLRVAHHIVVCHDSAVSRGVVGTHQSIDMQVGSNSSL